jgi:hypothetical protein
VGIHDVVTDLVVRLDLADDLQLLEVLFPACFGGDGVLLGRTTPGAACFV